MDRIVVFSIGILAAVITEVFWTGKCRRSTALWGGSGMLLLRRIVLRYPVQNRVLLCCFGALLLVVLRLSFLMLHVLYARATDTEKRLQAPRIPGFSYVLYRFMLIAPAYSVIEYLEACFGM